MIARISTPTMVASMLLACAAQATLYTDTSGEALGGNPHIDIVSVEVMNDATDIWFTISLAGDPIATDWGKYLVAIDSVPAGDTAGNGWGRPISMPSGMDYWIGSWVDAGDGAQNYTWGGASWSVTANPAVAKTTSSVKLTTSLASLGLSVSDSFDFDVFTTGGGGTDSAVDALANPATTIVNWNDPYASSSSLSFTVIPEPATFSMILVGLGAMVTRLFRRR